MPRRRQTGICQRNVAILVEPPLQGSVEITEVADLIHQIRLRAGLTQKELAQRLGCSPAVVSRVEDVQCQGHSLDMLGRIAQATGWRVEVRLVRNADE